MPMNPDEVRARAALAHDLSQPIQAIELYASALERRVDTEETRKLVARIRESVSDLRTRLAEFEP